MRPIVPVHELRRRVPEQGRIRMGVKTVVMESGKPKMKDGKVVTRPTKLNRFRFTSGDQRAMDEIARLYGGTVTPWPEGPTPGLLQVTVETEKIPIVLPPDPLGGTPIYELWSGGGCLRRCDGVEATLQLADNAGPDAQPAVVECPCRVENRMQCKPRTRLNVILRDVPFGGTWRVESTGWNAVEELPGQVDLILHVQGTGMSMGELSIARRTQVVRGKTKQFVVPSLQIPESIQALAEGEMRLSSMGKAITSALEARAALPAPDYDDADAFNDDEIVDGEIVDEAVGGADGDPPSPTASAPSAPRRGQSPQAKALHAALNDLMKVPEIIAAVDTDTMRHGLIRLVTEGKSESSRDIDPDQAHRAINLIADMLAGDRRFIGIADDGRARVSAHREAAG